MSRDKEIDKSLSQAKSKAAQSEELARKMAEFFAKGGKEQTIQDQIHTAIDQKVAENKELSVDIDALNRQNVEQAALHQAAAEAENERLVQQAAQNRSEKTLSRSQRKEGSDYKVDKPIHASRTKDPSQSAFQLGEETSGSVRHTMSQQGKPQKEPKLDPKHMARQSFLGREVLAARGSSVEDSIKYYPQNIEEAARWSDMQERTPRILEGLINPTIDNPEGQVGSTYPNPDTQQYDLEGQGSGRLVGAGPLIDPENPNAGRVAQDLQGPEYSGSLWKEGKGPLDPGGIQDIADEQARRAVAIERGEAWDKAYNREAIVSRLEQLASPDESVQGYTENWEEGNVPARDTPKSTVLWNEQSGPLQRAEVPTPGALQPEGTTQGTTAIEAQGEKLPPPLTQKPGSETIIGEGGQAILARQEQVNEDIKHKLRDEFGRKLPTIISEGGDPKDLELARLVKEQFKESGESIRNTTLVQGELFDKTAYQQGKAERVDQIMSGKDSKEAMDHRSLSQVQSMQRINARLGLGLGVVSSIPNLVGLAREVHNAYEKKGWEGVMNLPWADYAKDAVDGLMSPIVPLQTTGMDWRSRERAQIPDA